jgi:hypothetical protein
MSEISPTQQVSKKRPGGSLVELPIQGSNGVWYFMGEPAGESMQKDIQYYLDFWKKDHPEGFMQTIVENAKRAIKNGMIAIFVDKDGINIDEDKQKLSVYRLVIRSLGYQVGEFTFNKRSGNATATITPYSELK